MLIAHSIELEQGADGGARGTRKGNAFVRSWIKIKTCVRWKKSRMSKRACVYMYER